MGWLKKVSETLLPLSIERADIRLALKEWYYTGDAYDLEEPVEICQLCGHPDIRYQFTIVNRHMGFQLLVGSECIKKFEVHAVDEYGNVLDKAESQRKVKRDRRKLIANARKRRLINILVRLASVDQDFAISSFIDYFQDRGAFTSRQLVTLIWRLNKHQIAYLDIDFKMTIRRNREKDQLLKMQEWQIRQIWQCMSPSQKTFYIKEKGVARC